MRATRCRRQSHRRLLILALVCLIGSGGCAKPKPVAAPPPPPPSTIIVLLPDADGSVGQVTITNASGSQILSQGREASAIQGAGAAPSGPFVITDDEVKEKFGKTLATLPPEPVRFILYSRLDSENLTPESQALLPDFFRAVRERYPADVSIVGHTDTIGDREYNYRLGLRRANWVADLLVVQGVDRRTLDIDSHGKDDLLIKTGDQVPEPRNRRVEITVR